MVKVFTTNKNGKIELTREELQKILDDAYWEGYYNNHNWVYHSPSVSPYTWTISTSNTPNPSTETITCCSNSVNASSEI